MNGAAATITMGNTTAAASVAVTGFRSRAISGDDSSTTGSSAHADMVQSEVISNPTIGASAAGSSSGSQNAVIASRRSGAFGQSMSAATARLGLIAASARTAGSAA